MFPYQIARNPLSFAKIIGGLSKSLTIANQMIPLYQQAKPMIQNARNAFSFLKNLNFNSQSKQPNKTQTRFQNTPPQPPTTTPKFFL